MEIIVRTNNQDFIQNLKDSGPNQFIGAEEVAIKINEPTKIPGFFDSWFEICALVGILTIPVNLLTNLLSSWIWSSLQCTNSSKINARLIIRNGDKEVQMDLKGVDNATLKKIILEAITSVYSSS